MERANEPAESDVVVERLQTAPRFRSRRNIDEGEKNSGDDLQDEDSQRGTAEDIKPAGGVARDGMVRGFTNGRSQLQPPVEPFSDPGNQAHGGFFPRRAAVAPGVKSSPAWMVTRPFCTL